MNAGPLVAAHGVTVRFGGRVAIEGVTIEARAGELVGVVGPAACGKSVLLKALCLLIRPDSGSISIAGEDLTKASAARLTKAREELGFAFQNLALFDRLDAAANVAFALTRRGVPEVEARARAIEQLKAVGLAAATAKLPHELSGGMRRRLALARAMVSRPSVALYDDPFVGLDPVACARIARLIARAHRETGGATIVAAGDPSPLFAVADRLVLLENGRIEADLASSAFTRSVGGAVARYLGPEGVA